MLFPWGRRAGFVFEIRYTCIICYFENYSDNFDNIDRYNDSANDYDIGNGNIENDNNVKDNNNDNDDENVDDHPDHHYDYDDNVR